jgi:hypothetical protein
MGIQLTVIPKLKRSSNPAVVSFLDVIRNNTFENVQRSIQAGDAADSARGKKSSLPVRAGERGDGNRYTAKRRLSENYFG